MDLTEIAWRLGKVEVGLESVKSREDDRWGLVMMHLQRKSSAGDGHARRRWIQIAAYGATAIFSLLGITLPDRVAMVLRALMH